MEELHLRQGGITIYMARQWLVFVVAFILLGLLPPTARTESSKIVFAATKIFLGEFQIYAMNADGTNLTRLTDTEPRNSSPAFSPDGTKIAFESSRDGPRHIYLMNMDGSGQARLTNTSAADSDPAFSPDGSRIIFASDRGGCSEVYVMNTDGSGVKRLTTNPPRQSTVKCFGDYQPRFSPDGRKIVFVSVGRVGPGIYLMSFDGTGIIRLTNSLQAIFSHPKFSPDGQKIIFTSSEKASGFQIYTMNIDGSGISRLPNGLGGSEAVYSPDGTKIAFGCYYRSNDEICTMNADGTGEKRLTDTWGAAFPDWR